MSPIELALIRHFKFDAKRPHRKLPPKEKQEEYIAKWRAKNPEHAQELARIRQRRWRAKHKTDLSAKAKMRRLTDLIS